MTEMTTESTRVEDHHQDENAAPFAVRLFLEDMAVTALLRLGRALKSAEIASSAQGFSLPRVALTEALKTSTRLRQQEREWNLTVRASKSHLSREERDRQPLETTLSELLLAVGKPLPLPVIARELTFLRGAFQPNFKDLAGGALRNARWAVEVASDTFLHEQILLDANAPGEEWIVRENNLEDDPDFREVSTLALPATSGTLIDDLVAVLRAANRPLSHRMLGFLMWKQNNNYDPRAGARALSDRGKFYQFAGGYVALQAQFASLQTQAQEWARQSGGASSEVDVAALLRQRNVAHAAPAREIPADVIEDLKTLSRRAASQPVSLALVMTDVLEMEADDPQFAPTLQSLNDRLRSDADFLPVGIGKYLLRESVPPYVGEVPEVLRPIQLSVRDPETDEALDFEMSDDGLEGDCAEFIHAPQWDDVGEEAEVKLMRKGAAPSESTPGARYVVLNHHHRAGTLKLRRADEEFFGVSGPLTRLSINAESSSGREILEAWCSRESTLIYGLGDWFAPLTPPSGGVLSFARGASGNFDVKLDAPDKLTHIEGHRAEELESLREAANYMSLFELLQNIMREHGGGMELPTLWAEANMVRRTSKRLLCSVLSGYHCYYFKQRGPKQILWRFDAGKLDQGFKRNKRKYVRR